MCFGGGGGGKGGPVIETAVGTNPDGSPVNYSFEAGVPFDYVQRGATTMAQYQVMAQQDLSDKQIAAQKSIADQQNQFNQQQFDYQKQLEDKQQADAAAQAQRQSEYDTGRAGLLDAGTKSINDAFANFSPDYFNQYQSDYMAKAKDQVDYQKTQAEKNLAFGLARQGIGDSQASANQQGLLSETEGRTLADATAQAQDAANSLKANVAQSKQNLLGQVTASENIGSPIASTDEPGVQTALQTQRSAISGITNQAGDVTASLSGVPTVNMLSGIFSNVLGSAGSYLGGVNAQNAMNSYNYNRTGGLGGTTPTGKN